MAMLRDEILTILARHMPADTSADHLGQIADEIFAKVRAAEHVAPLNSTIEHLRDSPSSGELAARAAKALADQDEAVPQ